MHVVSQLPASLSLHPSSPFPSGLVERQIQFYPGSFRKVNLVTGVVTLSDNTSPTEAVMSRPLTAWDISWMPVFSGYQGTPEVGDTLRDGIFTVVYKPDGWYIVATRPV